METAALPLSYVPTDPGLRPEGAAPNTEMGLRPKQRVKVCRLRDSSGRPSAPDGDEPPMKTYVSVHVDRVDEGSETVR